MWHRLRQERKNSTRQKITDGPSCGGAAGTKIILASNPFFQKKSVMREVAVSGEREAAAKRLS